MESLTNRGLNNEDIYYPARNPSVGQFQGWLSDVTDNSSFSSYLLRHPQWAGGIFPYDHKMTATPPSVMSSFTKAGKVDVLPRSLFIREKNLAFKHPCRFSLYLTSPLPKPVIGKRDWNYHEWFRLILLTRRSGGRPSSLSKWKGK